MNHSACGIIILLWYNENRGVLRHVKLRGVTFYMRNPVINMLARAYIIHTAYHDLSLHCNCLGERCADYMY